MTAPSLDDYAAVAGAEVVDHLRQLAAPLCNKRIVHVNSTRVGGGVAEVLNRLVPLKCELGIDASWLVIRGTEDFFATTKTLHNGLQGASVELPEAAREVFYETNRQNAEELKEQLEAADYVFVHDPQPAPLLALCPKRRGKWIWRCHIDASRPARVVWKYLRDFVAPYDASVFSLAAFARDLPHPKYVIPPSIDPLAEKNLPLTADQIAAEIAPFGLDPGRPVVVQVSRFDRFKDPLGVVRAWQLAKDHVPVQLVLAGGGASDDPEGAAVLERVEAAAADHDDVHVLLLPNDAHRTINALQRRADIVLQKSIREGFGLTVTEALWKHKPVIGGDTGGIRLQVVPAHTGYLVNTPEGTAFRMRYLLSRPELMRMMGQKGFCFVRDHFLLTRHLREYLTLVLALRDPSAARIELS